MKKLIGSAPTLEMLKDGIKKYFYGTEIELKENGTNKWLVLNPNGVLDSCHVVKVKNRYRFERL